MTRQVPRLRIYGSQIDAQMSSVDIRRRAGHLNGMPGSRLPNAFVGMVLFLVFAYAGCERNAQQTSPPRTAQGHYNTDYKPDTDCTVTNDPGDGCCSNCRCNEEAVGINKASYEDESISIRCATHSRRPGQTNTSWKHGIRFMKFSLCLSWIKTRRIALDTTISPTNTKSYRRDVMLDLYVHRISHERTDSSSGNHQ